MVSVSERGKVTFSAIIPNYNHADYIASTLKVAVGQTVPFDEIIIIDDASTDDSVRIIRECIQHVPHVRLIQNSSNQGVIHTCNQGLEVASGDFLFFMSADDDYSPHIVEWCQSAVKMYPDVAMISGNTRICSITGKERQFVLPFPQMLGRYTADDIQAITKKRAFTFHIGANVLRRDAVISAGKFIPQLAWHCDWLLYLLIASRHPFAVIPHEFARVRQAEHQYSHACFDWKKQRPVIEAFVHILARDYPRDYGFFRRCAVLPTYDLQTLWLCLTHPGMRRYATSLLIWRLASYKLLRFISRLCPETFQARLRRWLRV